MYMRTELNQIAREGGALVKPLAAKYSNVSIDAVDSVLLGSALKVDFAFESSWTNVSMVDSLLDLRAFRPYYYNVNQTT